MILFMLSAGTAFGHGENVDDLRTQSGVDPTRVSTKAGYSLMYYDKDILDME